MTPDASLLRVLYDPVGWAAPGWLTHFGIDTRWPRRMGNELLLRRAHVSAVTEADVVSPGAAWLTASWALLPAAIYLAGARLTRNAIWNANALLRLHHEAYRFAMLPLAGMPCCSGVPLSDHVPDLRHDIHVRMLAIGSDCLRRAWPALPVGWRDRVRLRLPPQGDVANLAGHGPWPLAGAGCLRLLDHAITFLHAKNH